MTGKSSPFASARTFWKVKDRRTPLDDWRVFRTRNGICSAGVLTARLLDERMFSRIAPISSMCDCKRDVSLKFGS
jgi:hypothetical protein